MRSIVSKFGFADSAIKGAIAPFIGKLTSELKSGVQQQSKVTATSYESRGYIKERKIIKRIKKKRED